MEVVLRGLYDRLIPPFFRVLEAAHVLGSWMVYPCPDNMDDMDKSRPEDMVLEEKLIALHFDTL